MTWLAYGTRDRQVISPAQCTCATEALASGTGSTDRNISSIGRPSSRCIVFLMTCHGTGSALSRHFSNSRTYSSGKRVGELAMNCPAVYHLQLKGRAAVQRVDGCASHLTWHLHKLRRRQGRWEDGLPSLMYVAPSFSKSFLSITCSSSRCLEALRRWVPLLCSSCKD